MLEFKKIFKNALESRGNSRLVFTVVLKALNFFQIFKTKIAAVAY